MTEGQRLLVLTSADSPGLTAPLQESLAEWCGAGLLGPVVWSPALDLGRDGYEAACWHSAAGRWSQSTLGEAMSIWPLSEVWLAALRHPHSPQEPDTSRLARQEEDALQAVSGLLGGGIPFKSMTVGVAVAEASRDMADCAPLWDFHLIHDVGSQPHEQTPKVVAAERAPLELCALVALCSAGGWRGSQSGLDLPPDRADGPYKPVRFVHCQMRVLHTPSAASLARPSSMLTEPPWPLPTAAGVKRAVPGAVPPANMANELAHACGFRCNHPPRLPETRDEFVLTRLWRGSIQLWQGLFGSLPALAPDSEHEKAMQRLASRTGGLVPIGGAGKQGLKRLVLEGADDLVALASHLQRSDFPLPGGTAGAARATPEVWQTLREAMFGLVDGTTMPGGVSVPHDGEGGDAVRLVWTDPAGIAPRWAPPDASDILLGPDAQRDDPPNDGEEGEPAELGRSEELEGDHAGAGDREALMVRVGDTLHQAVSSAQRRFRENAALYSVGSEHEDAAAARKWARLVLTALGAALALLFVFAVGYRWPLGIITLVGGLTLFGFLAARLLENIRQLEEGNAIRRRLSEHASHFAAEVLRLRSMAEQYADHRLLITEFLYRPFGVAHTADNAPVSAVELRLENEPPASLLMARAEPDPEQLDSLHQLQGTSFMAQGWLVKAYGDALAVWRERHQRRVFGEAEDPDDDTTPPGSVIHRDRHDGSDVYGARTDLMQGVVGGGWVVRKAAEQRFSRLIIDIEGGVAGYLRLLKPIEPVHGAAGIGRDAVQFMELGKKHHWFAWSECLAPGAAVPRVDPLGTAGEPWLVADAGEDRLLVMAWHMDVSSPVRPQDLLGWQTGFDDGDSEGPSKQVV